MSDLQASRLSAPGRPVLTAGAPLGIARAAMLLDSRARRERGRHPGAGATSWTARISPTWRRKPPGTPGIRTDSWLPLESNEPYLSSALEVIDDLLGHLSGAGIGPERTVLLGFSQGACLALEYVARHPQRYGGVVGLSGALIGPPGTPRSPSGALDGTPVFMGCSDVDPHVPLPYFEAAA